MRELMANSCETRKTVDKNSEAKDCYSDQDKEVSNPAVRRAMYSVAQ